MTYAVIALIFVLAMAATIRGGLALGFMLVYIPVQLLISAVPPIPIPAWPDIGSPAAAVYGIVAGIILSGKKLPSIKWNLLDTAVLAVAASIIVSAGLTEQAYTAISMAGEQVIEWVLPYFMARMMFCSEDARRLGVRAIGVCVVILACFGFIETRLWPNYLSRHLEAVGLYQGMNTLAYHRFGLFRAQLTFQHPIDMGNVALLLVGIIPLLALTTELGVRNWFVRLIWAGAFFLVAVSISFTCYLGLLAAICIFLALRWIRWLRPWLVILSLLWIGAIIGFTVHVLSQKLPPRPSGRDALQGSLWVRKEIVHRAWAMGKDAGAFGYGKDVNRRELGLKSVDNAYMLLLLERGWVTLILFLSIPIIVAYQLQRALRCAADESQALPLVISMATIGGIMTAMYTVWFGFVYANLFAVALGFVSTLAEFFITQPATQISQEIMDNEASPLGVDGLGVPLIPPISKTS